MMLEWMARRILPQTTLCLWRESDFEAARTVAANPTLRWRIVDLVVDMTECADRWQEDSRKSYRQSFWPLVCGILMILVALDSTSRWLWAAVLFDLVTVFIVQVFSEALLVSSRDARAAAKRLREILRETP